VAVFSYSITTLFIVVFAGTSSQTIQIQGQYQTKETCEQYSYCDIDYTITNPDQCSGKMGCSNYCQYCTAPWWSSTTGACFAKTNFKVEQTNDDVFSLFLRRSKERVVE
jgi:hypothetical protein